MTKGMCDDDDDDDDDDALDASDLDTSHVEFPVEILEQSDMTNEKGRCCPICSCMVYHRDRWVGRRILLFRRNPGNKVRV